MVLCLLLKSRNSLAEWACRRCYHTQPASFTVVSERNANVANAAPPTPSAPITTNTSRYHQILLTRDVKVPTNLALMAAKSPSSLARYRLTSLAMAFSVKNWFTIETDRKTTNIQAPARTARLVHASTPQVVAGFSWDATTMLAIGIPRNCP